MNLILLGGQWVNSEYIKRVKALDGPIDIIANDEIQAGRKYLVYLDGGEEIMITQAEALHLWGLFGAE